MRNALTSWIDVVACIPPTATYAMMTRPVSTPPGPYPMPSSSENRLPATTSWASRYRYRGGDGVRDRCVIDERVLTL